MLIVSVRACFRDWDQIHFCLLVPYVLTLTNQVTSLYHNIYTRYVSKKNKSLAFFFLHWLIGPILCTDWGSRRIPQLTTDLPGGAFSHTSTNFSLTNTFQLHFPWNTYRSPGTFSLFQPITCLIELNTSYLLICHLAPSSPRHINPLFYLAMKAHRFREEMLGPPGFFTGPPL